MEAAPCGCLPPRNPVIQRVVSIEGILDLGIKANDAPARDGKRAEKGANGHKRGESVEDNVLPGAGPISYLNIWF